MLIQNNSSAVQIPKDYPVKFEVIQGIGQKKVKYNKDGTINRSHNNKIAGVSSEVYAFRTKEEIQSMIDVFDKHIKDSENENQKQIACRNKLLFLIGINVGIRASDLRSLKWSFFFEKQKDGTLKFKELYVLQPKKQKKKFVKLFFNQTVRLAINNYVAEYPIENLDNYLFPSRKGDEPILEDSMYRIIKSIASEAGIEQNIGSHSMRKTFGYHCFHEAKDKNKALVMLQQIFGHSDTTTTMRYIGLMDSEISDMYNSIELGLDMI